MESTSGFTGSEPHKNEDDKGDKKNKRTYTVSRPDLAMRYSYQQREVPQPQREAMGRALLDGVIFMRPAGEKSERTEEASSKEKKKSKAPSFEDIMQGQGFDREFVAATTKEGDKPKAEPAAESLPDVSEATHEESEDNTARTEPANFDDIMRRTHFDRSFVESTTKEGSEPKAELPEEPHDQDDNSTHIPPAAVPRGHAPLEQALSPAEQQAFDEVASTAELSDVSEQIIAEEALRNPVGSFEEQRNDDMFRDIVQQEGAPDPGSVRYVSYDPNRPRTFAASAGAAEAGAPDSHGVEDTAATSPTPEDSMPSGAFLPAGNVLRPGGLGSMGALEAQRRIDSLRHRAVEMGLAGGIAVLGLGLIGEHITAKRRDKKQQKQINMLRKDTKHMGQQFQQEQLAHQQTRRNLNRLATEHATTAEQLRDATTSLQEQAPAVAALAGAEAARRQHPEASTAPLQGAQPNAMPRQERFAGAPLSSKPEQTNKPAQNPEAEQLAAEQSEATEIDGVKLREGDHRVRESWYDAVVDREGRVVEGAITYGEGMQQERRQEQLRDRTADTPSKPRGNTTQAQGAATTPSTPSYQNMYQLPTYNSPALSSGMTTQSLPPGHPTREDLQHLLPAPKPSSPTTVLKKPWLWIFVGLLLLAFFVASLAG